MPLSSEGVVQRELSNVSVLMEFLGNFLRLNAKWLQPFVDRDIKTVLVENIGASS